MLFNKNRKVLIFVDNITVYRYNFAKKGCANMTIDDIIKEKKITKYRLSQTSEIPYTTLSDICNGKTNLLKCSAETVYRLAKALNVSIETLLEPYFETRITFDLFKSNVCHRLKELGDIDFLIETLEKDEIHKYYEKKWYPESFYLLAMVDYISRINQVPLCNDYDSIRKEKLQRMIFPSSVLAISTVSKDNHVKEEAIKNSIPEFIRFNIVESEVRNVI